MTNRTIALITSLLSLNTFGQISVSLPEGFYESPILLEISSTIQESTLHYTLDGTSVSVDDPRITGPILISESTAPPNLSFIPTSPDWEVPSRQVLRSTPLKVRAFEGETPITEEYTFHYFIDPNHLTRFPISRVLLNIDSIDFFSEETGIYVPGNNETYNFYYDGENWERPVEFKVYSPQGVLECNQLLGARIHGRSSRTNPQKSLRLYARLSYGSPFLFYPIFGESDAPAFKRLILRAPDRMFSSSLFTDDVIHQLVEPLQIENMNSRTVAVFINGEYWGIQNIRERLDEQHLRINQGVDPEKVDIIDWDREAIATEGNLEEFNKLMSFITTSDLSTEDGLLKLEKLLNIDEFIEYVGTHIYFANEDFPNNNVRMWRERSFGKKWNFFFYDCDACMRDIQQDSFERFSNERNDGNPVSILLSRLLKNNSFSNRLAEFLLSASANTFSSSNIMSSIEAFETSYTPLIQDQILRWSNPAGIEDWRSSIKVMKDFAIQRKAVINMLVEQYLDEPFILYPLPTTNELIVEFKMDIQDIPLTCDAFDNTGQKFPIHTKQTSSQSITIDTSILSPGTYILSVNLSGTIYYKKISKI